MRPRDLKLIDEIERDALNSDASISDTLRKLITLGGHVGSSELREWASHELRGYTGSDDDLPGYRKPSAVIEVDAIQGFYQITGRQISPRQLPDPAKEFIGEEVPLRGGIGEVEAMVRQAHKDGGFLKLTVPGSQDVAALWNRDVGNPYQNVTAIYWSMSEVALRGVVDQVRTTLVELVAEMQAGMPDSAETPSAEVADQAVQVAVHGNKARINITAATAPGAQVQGAAQNTGRGRAAAHHGGSAGTASLWRKLGAGIGVLAAVASVVIGLAQWQGWGI